MTSAAPLTNASIGPMLLTPVLLEKVWGGRRLQRLGKSLPSTNAKYGESWELSDMAQTSASGAGGAGVRSVIRSGPLSGRTLGDALTILGDELIPGSRARHLSAFPLLVKFLDAAENLSVQVHPSPAFAAANPGANLKTECWHILEAEPGAVIYKGIRPEVTRPEFERLARAGDPRIVETLIAIPASPGECHNLPSGAVHALGAGVLVAEVQTPSDTTFRLYDWGRTGRELHVEESLACASFPGEPGHAELIAGLSVGQRSTQDLCARLVTTEFFSVDALRCPAGDDLTIARACAGAAGCLVLIVLSGEGLLRSRGDSFENTPLRLGDTCVLASAIGPATLLSATSDIELLRVRIP